MTEQTPIVVSPSTVPEVAGTAVRDILVIAAAIPLVVKLIGARDLTGLLQWLQSSDGATVLAVVLPLAVSGWRAWRAGRQQQKFVTVARAAPDQVSVVTDAVAP